MSEDLREQVAGLLAAHGEGALPIVQAGDPVLRRPATAYTGQLGSLLAPFLDAMCRTMRAAPGVGLAAPQIGVGLAIAVIEDPGAPEGADDPRERPPTPLRVLVNPQYLPIGEERVSFFEGCLSVEGWQAVRSRYRSVRLVCLEETGAAVDEVLTGWPARIVQHETDHLRGELYLDAAEPRSLTSSQNLLRFWAGGDGVAGAGAALGF